MFTFTEQMIMLLALIVAVMLPFCLGAFVDDKLRERQQRLRPMATRRSKS